MKLELFPKIFSRNPQISNLIKILLVGVELFHAECQTNTDRQTDMEKFNNCFPQFCEDE